MTLRAIAGQFAEEDEVIIALDPKGRAAMTRDMELIREILRHVKSRQDANPRPVKITGYADAACRNAGAGWSTAVQPAT